MCSGSILLTRPAPQAEAFVVGKDTIPAQFREILSVENGIYYFKHNAKDPLECKEGDFVYYGRDYGEGPYLSVLDPHCYRADKGIVYARQPIYRACLVDESLPAFLSDVDVQLDNGRWILNTPRLRICVHFGDYWIRDIDPDHRYDIPVISVLERDRSNFEKFWICDEEGNLIEKLSEYDARLTFAPSF